MARLHDMEKAGIEKHRVMCGNDKDIIRDTRGTIYKIVYTYMCYDGT